MFQEIDKHIEKLQEKYGDLKFREKKTPFKTDRFLEYTRELFKVSDKDGHSPKPNLQRETENSENEKSSEDDDDEIPG